MKNFYKISSGQLKALLIFGIVGWFASLGYADKGEPLGLFLLIFIPFALIFYVIGWRDTNKKKELEDN